jgi:hypothetical protein
MQIVEPNSITCGKQQVNIFSYLELSTFASISSIKKYLNIVFAILTQVHDG